MKLTTENLGDILRLCLTHNYNAIKEALKALKGQGIADIKGLSIPKLNSSMVVFRVFLIDALKLCTEDLETKLVGTVYDSDITSYIDTAIWASNDDDSQPLDRHDATISSQLSAIAAYDCVRFTVAIEDRLSVTVNEIEDLTGQDRDHFYHDLWLTRNGHGCGYWEPEYKNDTLPTLGDDLTQIAKLLGECDLGLRDNRIIVDHTWDIQL